MNNKSVLLVDHEQEWLKFGHSALTKVGYFVETATNIQNALSLCQTKYFSLVLIDFNSMEQDEKVFHELVSSPNRPFVVVLSSMDLSPEKLRKAFNLGAFDCVEKCYDEPALRQVVEKQLIDIQGASKR
jgi:DNA-binding NtrC family response regulator